MHEQFYDYYGYTPYHFSPAQHEYSQNDDESTNHYAYTEAAHAPLHNETVEQKKTPQNRKLESEIKLITSNLDDNGIVQINNDLKDLRAGNNKLFRENNQQIEMNNSRIE